MTEKPLVSIDCENIAGLILAGGDGARLGQVRKADLQVGGHRLLDLACANLSGQCASLTIAIGTHPQVPPKSSQPLSFVADPGRGPAAAMLFASEELSTGTPTVEYILVTPCDAPFMPGDFAQRAMQCLDGSTAVIVGTHDGRTYPTHALWRAAALSELQAQFAPTDNPSIFALLDRVMHGTCAFDAEGTTNPFFNINTPADLIGANRRFAEQSEAAFS